MHWLWNTALDLLYPPRCCGCNAANTVPDLCARCLATVPEPQPPLCTICGVPFAIQSGDNHVCIACLRKPPRFRQARACATYDASATTEHPLKLMLQRYKYNHDVTLAPPLARLLSRCLADASEYDLVVPVPLHVTRLRWRGFNQAMLLTRYLSPAVRARVDPHVLARVRPTRPQVELDQSERASNVSGAFQVADKTRVRGKRILLLDDVLTTGATVDECARVLRRGGAKCVDVVVLARAVLH